MKRVPFTISVAEFVSKIQHKGDLFPNIIHLTMYEHSFIYIEPKTLYDISKDFTVIQKKNNYKLNIEY